MRIIVHVGMPKTGTSSVQAALAAAPPDAVRAARLGSPNHSGSMVLLFDREDLLGDYHGFWPRGPAYLAQLPERRRTLRAEFDRQLDAAVEEGLPFVISAESLWSSKRPDVRNCLNDALRRRNGALEVIGYLRPPLSYAASAFQQRLKGPKAPKPFSLERLMPSYARGIQAVEQAFGRNRVRWRLYRSDALLSGNVVADFAAVTDLSIDSPDGDNRRLNTSLPAEAAAFLYAQRRGGLTFPSGFREAPSLTRKLIVGLRRLGHRRLAFAPALAEPARARVAEEIALAESRIGRSLAEETDQTALLVGSEADILAVGRAVASHDVAREFLDAIQAVGSRRPAPLAPGAGA